MVFCNEHHSTMEIVFLKVNEKLNTQYPKLLQAVSSDMNEKNKKAVVYKFIETLQELVEELKK